MLSVPRAQTPAGKGDCFFRAEKSWVLAEEGQGALPLLF